MYVDDVDTKKSKLTDDTSQLKRKRTCTYEERGVDRGYANYKRERWTCYEIFFYFVGTYCFVKTQIATAASSAMAALNSVATLNEYAQRKALTLKFEDLGSDGPDHNRRFIQRVILDGKPFPEGVGKNKKEAKQNAAEKALKCLNKKDEDISDLTNSAEASSEPTHQTDVHEINYICWLNEYGQKKRLTIKPVESTKPGLQNTVFFLVGKKQYPTATGKTKREAKEKAAKLVYQDICGSKTESADENSNCTLSQQQEELNQSVSDICDETTSLSEIDTSFKKTNYKGFVNDYCQEKQLTHSFIEVNKYGPPHNCRFVYKLVIDKKDYPQGEGKSVKEAKQNAAQLAWFALREQFDLDSEGSISGSTVSGDPSSALNTGKSSPQGIPMSISDSIVFADSSSPAKVQKSDSSDFIVLKKSSNRPKDQVAVQNKTKGISLGTLSQSRFTSEFDNIQPLDKGGFGQVYKAKEKLLKRYYAVKIVRGNEKALKEVTVLSDLQHINIVRYYNCWMEDSKYQDGLDNSTSESTNNQLQQFLYIKMELCNKTLKDWIKSKNEETVEDSKRREGGLSVAQQIVNGVEYIHSQKLIHRDLKPANILFGKDEKVKIGDFGLVTVDVDDTDEIERTQQTGTIVYMAPEQKSEKNYDRKVDIFALGLIYLELLWKLSTNHERYQIFQEARSHNFSKEFSSTFPEEKRIIKLMLSEKPEDRPEASKLKAKLKDWAKRLNSLPEETATV